MSTDQTASSGRQAIDWAGLGWLYLFFWYFSGITQLMIGFSGAAGFQGLKQASTVTLVWLIPPLLFPRATRVLTAITGGLLWLCSLAGFGYFLVYRQEFSQSVLFIMFESNTKEASEYLEHYFSWSILLATAIYGLGGYLLWRRIRPVHLPRRIALVTSLLLFTGSMGYEATRQYFKRDTLERAISEFEENIEAASPWQLLVGYHQYRQQLDSMAQQLASQARIPPLQDLADAHAGEPVTLVLVLGESTNRQRMSLYGYPRPTTPNLDRIRDELQVFDHVVTPRPYTIEALEQVLTFADQEHPDRYLTTPSLVKVMKQAGYRTWWITNQQTMTRRNTMLTTFSEQTDQQVYLNNNRDQNLTSQYDGDVLAPFASALADPAPRKFIVVHLLGTHMRYQYRYPNSFSRFTDRTGVPASVTDDQLPTYNSYDNAVLYNDHVVSSLISHFRSTNPKGFLLYLADHGEAVFDAPHPGILGRNEAAPTSPMYTVPFILWRSEKWRQAQPGDFSQALHRPYSTSSFIYTWADLAGLRFTGFDPSKSLVSPDYKAYPLLIGNPQHPRNLIDFSLISPRAPAPATR